MVVAMSLRNRHRGPSRAHDAEAVVQSSTPGIKHIQPLIFLADMLEYKEVGIVPTQPPA